MNERYQEESERERETSDNTLHHRLIVSRFIAT